MRTGVVLAAVLIISGFAAAEDAPKSAPPAKPPAAPPSKPTPPPTPEQAADAVLAAVKAKDDAALRALATKDEPDPWLVADELLARNEHTAAHAFAKEVPRKDVERLPAYVASRRWKSDDEAARKALAAANEALAAGKPKDSLEVLRLFDATAPADVVGIRRAFGRGLAFAAANRLEESATAFLVAADAAERMGWLGRASKALQEAGMSAGRRSDFRGALSAWERRLLIAQTRGDRAGVAATLGSIGIVHTQLANYPKAFEYQERALKMMEESGDRAGVARTLGNIGNIHGSLKNIPKALECHERALKVKEELGNRAGVAITLGNIGSAHYSLGNYPKALEYHDRAMKMMEELGNRAGVAATLGSIGLVQTSLGNYPKALEYQERAMKMSEELGDRAGVVRALGNIGAVHRLLGNYPKALEHQERALRSEEALGDRGGVAQTLHRIAITHDSLGDYPKALEYHERALKMEEELGDRAGVAKTLGNIGIVHTWLGNYTKAIEYQERALKMEEELGDRAGVAATLGNIGAVHASLANYPKALKYHERALKMKEELGNRAGVATTLGSIGLAHSLHGNSPKALEYQERALRLKEELGNRAGVAITLGNIGLVHHSLGNYPKALEYYERALKMKEELGNRGGVASTLGNIGKLYYRLGDYPKALEYHERAVAVARDAGRRDVIVQGLWGLAKTHLVLGAPAEAARLLREAIDEINGVVAGLAEEQAAIAREQFTSVFENGVQAAQSLGDAAGASFFLESGRAGTLLEGLGGRERLQGQSVPEELRKAEALARAREAVSLALYRRARDVGELAETRQLRSDLDAARDGVKEVIERIQREEKKAADVVYPKAAELVEIQTALAEGEALVLYGLFSEDAMALVVTRKDARIVDLGKAKPIETAYAAAMLEKKPFVDEGKFAALRDLVVKPLTLRGDTKRVLVSPHGVLSYAPASMLFPDYEVVEVPSGTTYRLLADDRSLTGEGVLALGDPDVDARPNPTAVALYVEGVRARSGLLGRLPDSREEARAVGDVLLIDKEASEAGLRDALAKRPRWRAVHLACHGLVDPENPTLSSLALTPSGEDDGFLTALDVFRMKIPSDLVVLSACETGMGKVYRSEGIVGLTRAFMFAGSPRVLCSLWRVDDEATRALMVKFYELWNPKDRSKAMGTAAALKAAQEYVRTREVEIVDTAASQREGRTVTKRARPWEHPYYWAAWVLWGLAS